MNREERPVAKQRLRVVEGAEGEDGAGPDVAPQLLQALHVLQGRLGGQVGGIDGADGRSDDDVRLDAGLEERLEHPDVDAAEVGAAREHEPDHGSRLPYSRTLQHGPPGSVAVAVARAPIVVLEVGVVVDAVVAAGIGVDDRRGQPGHVVEEAVAGVLGDAVGGGQGEVAVDFDLGLGVEAVADPADAQLRPRPRRRRPRPARPGPCSARAGSTASMSRASTSPAASRRTETMSTAMARPAMASARSNPAATPMAPARTPSELRPSVRAWRPSATRAAEPISRPTRIRYWATSSLPAKPTSEAAITAPR